MRMEIDEMIIKRFEFELEMGLFKYISQSDNKIKKYRFKFNDGLVYEYANVFRSLLNDMGYREFNNTLTADSVGIELLHIHLNREYFYYRFYFRSEQLLSNSENKVPNYIKELVENGN